MATVSPQAAAILSLQPGSRKHQIQVNNASGHRNNHAQTVL